MSNENKLDTKALVFNTKVFVERQLYREKNKTVIFKSIYYFLNVLTILAAFGVATVSAFVIKSASEPGGTYPLWFFLATAAVSAFTGLFSSIISFFYIKEKMVSSKANYLYIKGQIISYESNASEYSESKDKDFMLFHNVTKRIGFGIAQEGDE